MTTAASPMHAHTYRLRPPILIGVSSILMCGDFERDACISSAVCCSLHDAAISACFTAVLHMPVPNVSLRSVMALPALTAFPYTLVRNASRLGPRGVPLIPGGFGAATASQSEQTHSQHTWVTVTAFGISYVGYLLGCGARIRDAGAFAPAASVLPVVYCFSGSAVVGHSSMARLAARRPTGLSFDSFGRFGHFCRTRLLLLHRHAAV